MRKTKEKRRCLACGHIIERRQIALYSGLVYTLWRVFEWCKQKGRHEFQTKDIKHFFNLNSSARFGDLVMFGGLVYKDKKAHYGLNMARCEEFFAGRYKIPEWVLKDPITGNITQGPDITLSEVPHLDKFLNQDGEFRASYFRIGELPDCPACTNKDDFSLAHKLKTNQHPV